VNDTRDADRQALQQFPLDLAVYPSIASSPKSQVKTVGLLINR